MNKNFAKVTFLGMLFVTVILTGCGGEFAGVNRAVSEGAVSGGAVSGGVVSGNAEKKYRYSTDTNLYYNSLDGDVIMQARRDGTHKKEIFRDENTMFLLEYVDENWLYYLESGGKEGDALYRIPLEKDADGYDVVKKSEKEELVRQNGFYSIFWDSRYVIYDNEEEIMKYDLLEKKVVSRQRLKELENHLEGSLWEFFRLPDCYVAVSDEGGIYAQDREGTDWRDCGDKQWINADWGKVAQTENNVFYEAESGQEDDSENWSIWKCDGKKAACFVTMNQLKQAVEQVRGVGSANEVSISSVYNIYGDTDRLYLQIALSWEDGNVYRMEYLLFSQGEEEKELRYEKALTECMQSHVKSRRGKWGIWDEEKDKMATVYKENVVVNDAQCVCILNGNAYLSLYDYEQDSGRLGCYELQSGKFRWVSKREAAYGELGGEGVYYWNDSYDYQEEGVSTVFENEEDNDWVGVWRTNPLEREDRDFYETK